jgi:eukaryotic-like serine/threonine-protein kinase
MSSAPITPRPPVPIAMGSSDPGTEEGRAFHQDRLALLGRWMFIISGSFLAFFIVVRIAGDVPFDRGVLYHAFGSAVAGVVRLLGSRVHMTVTAMQVVDVAAAWLMSASWASMTVVYAGVLTAQQLDAAPALFVGLLATTYTLMARAIAVPSTAFRTLWVSTAAWTPLLIATSWMITRAPAGSDALLMASMDVMTWQIAAVAMSAVASRVIFGLRAEVAQSRRMGQYTLGEQIGEGGMGAVYRAHHAMLRRPTAIKLLPPEKAGADNILRFEREVQLTASLSHPNTVVIFDYGRTLEGVFYYAMEYLDGINLDQLVKADGPQPPGRVVRILSQVCGALAEAHEIGLVHRDIKPGNIILCERGGVPDVAKVVDFGLVKRFRPDNDGLTIAVTAEQTLLGTPLYMAPEALTGSGDVDARSDLYALGAVAYLLLTGTTVFRGRTVVEICAHHLHTPPEPPSRRLGQPLPPGLEQVVLACLAKSPDDRPSSALALHDRLAHLRLADTWSDDDATAWWLRHRRTAPGVGANRAHDTSVDQ